MPKLYEYFGLSVLFYANEHEPIHVHGKYQGKESKAEIIIVNGVITEIKYDEVTGKRPLEGSELRDFKEVVEAKAAEIVQKWKDFFVDNKPVEMEMITKRLKTKN